MGLTVLVIEVPLPMILALNSYGTGVYSTSKVRPSGASGCLIRTSWMTGRRGID